MAFHLAPTLLTFLLDLDSTRHSNTEEVAADAVVVVDDDDVQVKKNLGLWLVDMRDCYVVGKTQMISSGVAGFGKMGEGKVSLLWFQIGEGIAWGVGNHQKQKETLFLKG